jgi:Flagellar hook-length control protein
MEPAVDERQEPEGPVIISEDNTRADEQPAKQYDQLPENQQDNPVEIGAKSQTQSAGKDTKGSDDKESGNFGQNNTAQNFQNNLSETGAAATAEGVEKFTSESTENIMRQLADMVKIVKNENLTEMELQLHPASLGTVNVSLTTKGGMVTAEFTTQNEAVKAAIEAQATQLRANLEEQGVKVEAIEVSVESHQMERNLDKNGQEQQRQAQEQETMRVQGMRRGRSSINLRAFADGEELEGEMQGADDATRIAMEIMAANGNTMDLLV